MALILRIMLAMALATTACGGRIAADDDEELLIVASTTILGDVVRQMADGAARIDVLMPVGVDPHDFAASASQAAALRRADLVVVNGLGLERGLEEVLEGARADGTTVLEIAPELDPLPMGTGGSDPHVWLDPVRMAAAVVLIGDALADLDPVNAEAWRESAADYRAEVLAAHEAVAAALAPVPAGERLVVTDHDFLRYFADRYGFEIVGVVVPGGSTLAEPSAGDLADLIVAITRSGVRAVLTDTARPPDLAEVLTRESGVRVAVVPLYVGSLGEPGSGAETYLSMLLLDAERISGALTP